MTIRLVTLLAALGTGSALMSSPAAEVRETREGLERLAGGGVLPVGADRVAAGMVVTVRDSVPGDAMATGGQVTVATREPMEEPPVPGWVPRLAPWLGTLVKVLATAFGLGAAAVVLRDAAGASVEGGTGPSP